MDIIDLVKQVTEEKQKQATLIMKTEIEFNNKIADLINKTPTSELRNELSELQILFLQYQKDIRLLRILNITNLH